MTKEAGTRAGSVVRLTVGLFVLALALFAPLSANAQVTINGVVVVLSSPTGFAKYCDTSQPAVAGCTSFPWDSASHGFSHVLAAGQTLVLTQTSLGASQPNFDTSDRFPSAAALPPPVPAGENPCGKLGNIDPCVTQIFIDTGAGLQLVYTSPGPSLAHPNGGDALSNFNFDTLVVDQNEAENFQPASTPSVSTYTLALGYADNVHGLRTCSLGILLCAPDPFDGTLNTSAHKPTFFIGDPEPATPDCPGNCYDAGVLLITALNNPSVLTSGDTATIGFWHNKNGQAVINCLNGGPTSTSLGNYLALTYPSLFGAGPNAISNLAGLQNQQIAALYLGSTFFGAGGQKVNAQILGAALATYVTSSSLSGGTNCGAKFGFNFSLLGTGNKTYNVGSLGTAIGLSNNTSYTIAQLLQAASAQKAAGTFNANAFNTIFDGINQKGDIT